MINYLERANKFTDRIAIISNDELYTYKQLVDSSNRITRVLLENTSDLNEARIAFLIDPSFEYTATQWGIWKAGGIAVPLCVVHPLKSIHYVLEDTECKTIIITKIYFDFIAPIIEDLGLEVIIYESIAFTSQREVDFPYIELSRRAMILYTSGTTNLPKGVVTTHANIEAQIKVLVEAWRWNMDDHILNILPLHHVHGIINVMSCALWAGACCEFLPKFDATAVWHLFTQGKINVFMAVPTIYFKLIKCWNEANEATRQSWSESLKSFRLMVSGSAALPVSVLNEWKEISGHILLERYGMTEIGMGLSNSYEGERRPGHVGQPLPGVEMKLVNESGQDVKENESGQILIKGPGVFLEYWNNPKATEDAFTNDGWFKTGDVAILNDGLYKILGRTSVDIIKSGGYKISALEIEEVLRTRDDIADCGVVGIKNDEWGQVVCAALVSEIDNLNIESVKEWIKEQLPAYKVPRKYIFVDDLPRNTLGKVTKKELLKLF